ncbi:MAG: subclass B3 metallo-beta-lactamase [Asticcacaulis sp.]|nr:subclass B3 metallo-beta-lactamase [Asticcacaulis sp.]
MKSAILALFLSGALFSVSLPALAADPDSPSWHAPHEPYRIIDNIYYVGTEGIGVYLITTDQGHFLIDSGPEGAAPIVEANIRKLGFDPKDIKYLLETHAHYDHVGAMAQLKADTGAQVVVSLGDRNALATGRRDGDNIFGPGLFPPVKADRAIGEGDTLYLGDTTLMAHMTPGHTKGDTCWTMTVVNNGVPYRVLFYGSMTVAGNVLVDNKAYPTIVRDYRIAFDRLADIKPDIFLANHSDIAHLEEKHQASLKEKWPEDKAKPFIDPNEFPAFLARVKADFEAELAKQQAAAGQKP